MFFKNFCNNCVLYRSEEIVRIFTIIVHKQHQHGIDFLVENILFEISMTNFFYVFLNNSFFNANEFGSR